MTTQKNATQFDFDTPVDRRGTASWKWEEYKGREVIPLWVADMDFRSPPAVIEALHGRVEHGVFGYTRPPEELSGVIGEALIEAYGWPVDPDWLVWLPGLVTGLHVACWGVGEDGDDVLTATPVYPPFLSAPGRSRRNAVTVPLAEDGNRWTFDFERLEGVITPRTRLLLLCSPHNPVGRVYTRAELERLADICLRHDLILCSDEIHCGLVLEPGLRHIPTATLSPEVAARTITLMAPSKTFNIPGLGFAFAVIPDVALRRRFAAVMEGIVPHVNLLGYTAAVAAYRHGAAWRTELIDYLRANRDLVEHEIASMPGLKTGHVEATYLAWIDARGLAVEHPQKFFETAGVGLSDGAPFGAPGWLRLNFACPRTTLLEALARMRRGVTW